MRFSAMQLCAPLFTALCLAACRDSTSPPRGQSSNDSLRLLADGQLDLTDAERYVTPGDSFVVRAVIVGNAANYNTPVISASDTSAITRRADGSVALRHAVSTLVLTATASARTSSSGAATLTATGRLNIACTAVAIPGISVTLQDSVTGIAPAGTGTVRYKSWSTSYADSLIFPGPFTGWGTAWERAGVYTVSVDLDGYLPWRRDGIEVTRGICHVRTVSVVARLQRK